MVKKLKGLKEIYLDTSIFIYYFEGGGKYEKFLDNFFEYCEENKLKICISVLVLTELLVKPYGDGNLGAVARWLDYFKYSSLVEVLEVSPKIALDAAYVRGRYGLKTPDSLHLATAMQGEKPVFLTNDKALKRVEEVEILCLSEL